jgi:two-component system response regulator HydG
MNATGLARVVETMPRDSAVGTVLIVNDERTLREDYRDAAQTIGFNAFVADTAEHAYRMLEALGVDVVLLDLKVPGGGLEALRQMKARRPEAFVIIITSFASVHSAVQAMKLGAYDYLTKPFSPEELKAILQRVGNELKDTDGEERLRSRQGFGAMVGRSPEMEKLYRIIAKAAQSTHPVLILGESGTGKELVARCIHFSGPTKDKPFVPFDCGSITPSLLEGELFGYVKGALPGAQRSKDGLFAIAEGGTLFLDEVGELPIDFQAKLLRAIQEHEIRPVGSAKRVPFNVRILAATNRDLEQAVAEGRLRRDLYFRLNVLTLRIPALRERRQDVPVLAQHILERLARSMGTQHTLSEEALKAMLAYDWPGNVRELENCLERACTMSTGPILRIADLSSAVQNAQLQGPRGVPTGPRIVPLADIEKQAILSTIDQLNGDKLLAARLLGIGKTTLYRKLKEYEIG